MEKTMAVKLVMWCVACLWASAGFGGRENILRNANLKETDGIGGALGWCSYGWRGARMTANAGENGCITLKSDNSLTGYYRQSPVGLRSGGHYRFSAEVRGTIPEGAGFRFICCTESWDREVKIQLPADTRGEWVQVAEEMVAPETKNPNGYALGFAGTGTKDAAAIIEIRNIRLESVTDDDETAVRRLDLSAKKALRARIVPIDPLLNEIREKNAEMTFYWPATPSCGVANCTLKGILLLNGADPGKRAQAKFDAQGRAKLTFGRIGGENCRYRMALQVRGPDEQVLARESYWITGHPEPPQGPVGRRLNNFVTELVNAELQDGVVDFFLQKSGWVWISFENSDRNALGWLDDFVPPAVAARPEESLVETMRHIKAGWHHLKILGAKGGRLRIHSVKRLAMPVYSARGGACDFSGFHYKYTFPFVRRYMLDAMNVGAMKSFLEDPHDPTRLFYASRGIEPQGCLMLHYHYPHRDDGEKIYKELSAGAWVNGWNCVLDENKIFDTRHNQVAMSETLWRMVNERPRQALDVYWGDATNFSFDDPQVHTSMLSAIFNSGDGTGVHLPEVYAPALTTPEATDIWIDLFARQVRQVGELVPGGADRTCLHLSPYINMAAWTDEPCPETDIKAHYARMMRIFATDPRFAANAGIGSGAAGDCEEELRRWHARCMRYYAVEGGTGDLALKYGFSWNPGIVENPDFASGLSGWTTSIAPGGAIRADRVKGYGSNVQHRMKIPRGVGDSFAEFTASSPGINRLSQKLTGLEPGRFYSLRFSVANRENAAMRMKVCPEMAFSARLEGVEEVDGLNYWRRFASSAVGMPGSGSVYLLHRRIVFKAKSQEAVLTFCDCGPNGETVSPGTRQVVNFVMCRPYYCESPEEPYELAKLFKLEKLKQE